MKCDKSINQACEALGSFEMIEEVINSVFGILSTFQQRHFLLTALLPMQHNSFHYS